MIMTSQSGHIFHACDFGLVVLESLWSACLQLLCFAQSILVNSHCIHWILLWFIAWNFLSYIISPLPFSFTLLLIQIGLKGEKWGSCIGILLGWWMLDTIWAEGAQSSESVVDRAKLIHVTWRNALSECSIENVWNQILTSTSHSIVCFCFGSTSSNQLITPGLFNIR